MEMMVGKYMMETMGDMDMCTKAMCMSADMMKKMMGSPGMMLEIMVNGNCMTMKRSDGMNMCFTMGEECEMQMCNMMIKVMPKMKGNMLMMMMTMPDGKMMERSYKFTDMGMVMEMMCKDMMVKACYKRM